MANTSDDARTMGTSPASTSGSDRTNATCSMAALSRIAAKSSGEHDRRHELGIRCRMAGAEDAIDFLAAELETSDRVEHAGDLLPRRGLSQHHADADTSPGNH
jgi:hypothetical protein